MPPLPRTFPFICPSHNQPLHFVILPTKMAHHMRTKTTFKSGFVSIIGAPNVGKSTLLNRILGQKIAITSAKPQTTRNRIMGICHLPQAQLIFLDTPGIHRGKGVLNKRMVEVAMQVLADADLAILMIDGAGQGGNPDKMILQALRKEGVPVILAMNKVDLIKKKMVLPLIDRWRSAYPFEAIIPISALQGIQVDELVSEMIKLLPEGPRYYPEENLTDVSQRFIAAEVVREKVFRLTGDEIPYSVAVVVESFKERVDKDLVEIYATIYVERQSQKPIIIGKKGKMLKQIGEYARKDIEQMVGRKVFLRLWVQVRKNWTKDEKIIKGFGY